MDIAFIQKNLNGENVIEMLAKVPSGLVCCSYSVSKNQIGTNLQSHPAIMKEKNPKYQNCVIAEYL